MSRHTSNPTLGIFEGFGASTFEDSKVMTIGGTALKTGFLAFIVFATAAMVWSQFPPVLPDGSTTGYRNLHIPAGLSVWLLGGTFAGLGFAIAICWNPKMSPYLAPLYAASEGVAMGGFSSIFESGYPGIVIQAVGLTAGTLVTLLTLYMSGLIKPSENFKLGIVAATGGICLVYLASMVLGLFGVNMPVIHDTGWVGNAFSLFVVTIAALNLVLDFDTIEKAVEQKLPRYMEWYGAFSLMVTLIWLYVEILKLLAKAQSKR